MTVEKSLPWLSFYLYSTEMLEINFNEQDRSEIENAVIPLENEVTLSLRPTQIPFTIEIIHTTIPDALDESRATPGKISFAVEVYIIVENAQSNKSEHYVLLLDTAKLHFASANLENCEKSPRGKNMII